MHGAILVGILFCFTRRRGAVLAKARRNEDYRMCDVDCFQARKAEKPIMPLGLGEKHVVSYVVFVSRGGGEKCGMLGVRCGMFLSTVI